MDIELTSDEITYAKKRVVNYGRLRRRWTYLRIFIIIAALFQLVLGLLWLWLLENQNNSEEFFTANTSFESMQYKSVKNYIDKKSNYNRVQIKAGFFGFIFLTIGVLLLIAILVRWNSHKIEPLDVKLYKILLGNKEKY